MNTIRDLAAMVRENPRLAIAAATGDIIIATITTLVVLKIVGVI